MDKLKPILDQLFAHEIPKEVLKESHYEVFEQIATSKDSEVSLPAKVQLRNLFGKDGNPFSNTIGTHPDFKDLSKGESRNQYICSLFLDISGSTKLGLKFPLRTVRFYKNAILKTAIEIFKVFDGHIHRLQGDAVFAFFGHKDMKKSDAIINALNAASLMQAYNKYTLSEFFKANGLEPLRIRIGIDIGDEHQVLWSFYGLDSVSEVTSTSIHTDLAAKLQAKSPRNNIMIGENIYSYIDLPDEFIKTKTFIKDKKINEEKYVLYDSQLQAYYQMRIFDWEKYLNSFAFLQKEKNTRFSSPYDFEIICEVSEDLENIVPYKSNSRSIQKGTNITFKLILKKSLTLVKPSRVEWTVINRGNEASEGERALTFAMDKYKNKYVCKQSTKYNGHHYMGCKFYDSQGKLIGQDRFGIYVNDEKSVMKELGVNGEVGLVRK
ncbi:adenylate/guanylate cyclase domain-containing protein [Bacillus cereus]|uniref:adenylate/guanylate cyclase domain-containing protein n=1 Tax=Bacillus cereus TaxID=1396 RepID=UPI00144463D6|nr:adenylate/guanylate cyclase domain-containing protein [Bacillus cereus]MDA1913624.1 adenylate/guanylate cyclase domain-containing protein [Bacillus cereus]MDA2659744.1 adenylate/guanylate cyclase domain-containing protein [Bacillus cereus]NKX61477.1 adenylate/guanylate cyclase domain-containing protein [Bacillus cereus]